MEAFRSTHGDQPRTLMSAPRETLCIPKQVGLGIFTAFGDFFDPEGNEVAYVSFRSTSLSLFAILTMSSPLAFCWAQI